MVIALDADLNTVSLHAIKRFGNKNPLIDRRYILNEYKPSSSKVEVYSNENHLLADMLTNLKKGQRLFIACNSKKRVEELVETIKNDLGSDFPLYSITSANSNDPAVIDFIKNIKVEPASHHTFQNRSRSGSQQKWRHTHADFGYAEIAGMHDLNAMALLYLWRARKCGVVPKTWAFQREPWHRRNHARFHTPALKQVPQARFYEYSVVWASGVRIKRRERQYFHPFGDCCVIRA